jgi:hypothetical protein
LEQKVYKFANRMQIESLTQDLVNFFNRIKAPEMFAVFDLYLKHDGNEMSMNSCKQVMFLKFIFAGCLNNFCIIITRF